MNIKLIGVIILVLVIGVSSYYISINAVDDTKISNQTDTLETNLETKTSYFEKNRKCVQSKNDIEKKLSELNAVSEWWDERLLEVFYSKEHDSCMYIGELNSTGWDVIKRLMDYRMSAGSEPIDSCEYISSEIVYQHELQLEKDAGRDTTFLEAIHKRIERDNCEAFDQRINELKNI